MKNKNKKYWSIRAKFGHVGDMRFIEIDVPCIAKTKDEAVYKVNWNIGGVKHGGENTISRTKEISKSDYKKLVREYKNHPYIKAKRNCAQRLNLMKEIKSLIKTMPKVSQQDFDNKESSLKFKRSKYKLELKRAIDDIRMYTN